MKHFVMMPAAGDIESAEVQGHAQIITPTLTTNVCILTTVVTDHVLWGILTLTAKEIAERDFNDKISETQAVKQASPVILLCKADRIPGTCSARNPVLYLINCK